MHWRQSQPALRWGDIQFIEMAEPVLAFTRNFQGETLLAVFNLADATIDIRVPVNGFAEALSGHGLLQGTLHDGQLRLPGYGLWFASLQPSDIRGATSSFHHTTVERG